MRYSCYRVMNCLKGFFIARQIVTWKEDKKNASVGDDKRQQLLVEN